jgi:hypothetical protein
MPAAEEELPQRALAFIRQATPFAYCDACLALRLRASLSEMVAALAVFVRDGQCDRRRRACYGCGRTLDVTGARDDRVNS